MLYLDVATRWNFTYLMLEKARKFQKVFDRLHDEDPLYRNYFAKGVNESLHLGPPQFLD
ncbi:hypothetical protein CJ030_MR2G026911 [Morella rubra]|uniref:Uncharacterized protein n=1 Tax=Morella rubra TaxID=262757 RepID=A0A6A1WHS2_9ROSI|nr:hypothetical protein CJ030_MR2G026911 [Morella rubra]